MSTLDDVKARLYWERVERGIIVAVKLLGAQERLEQAAAHKRWERHWRTRFAEALHQLADKLTLPEPMEELGLEREYIPMTRIQ